MLKKYGKKIILIILILFVLTGIIILGTIGFEKSITYEAGTRIEVYLPKGYDKQDIQNIAKESFKNTNFSIEEIEKLNQVVGIKIKDYTQEQLDTFKKNITEKYEIEEDKLELYEISIPATRITNIVVPYVFPALVITVLSLVYVALRNIKQKDKWKLLLKIVSILVLTLGIYFSIILIFRLPFGIYTMPLAIFIYFTTLMILTNHQEKINTKD